MSTFLALTIAVGLILFIALVLSINFKTPHDLSHASLKQLPDRPKRKVYADSMVTLCGDPPTDKPPQTKEEKEKQKRKEEEARSPASMLKRAANKIDELTDEDDLTIVKLDVFYGKDEEGHKDVRVFAEETNGDLIVYIARRDPGNDSVASYEKAQLVEIEEIVARQIKR